MTKYILRLDDACPRQDREKWDKIEQLCDKYCIKPLVGVIPKCSDGDFNKYNSYDDFWDVQIKRWQDKGWELALHGFDHVFLTDSGGINPVNKKSEFAGLPLGEQREKIANGIAILNSHNIYPRVFFAPAHTYDKNTLLVLKELSEIRVISDTPAFDCYIENDFVFIPLQSNRIRKLPFRTVTFCYHPNTMSENDFLDLESFMKKHDLSFEVRNCKRNKSFLDKIISWLYFKKRK